jgi:Zn-dependent M28 family amino/carboxypeptidase
MKTFRALVLTATLAAGAITLPAQATTPPAQASAPVRKPVPASAGFDGGRAYEYLRQIVNIGPRPAGSPAIERTRTYITDQLNALGISAAPQAFDAQTPIGRVHMVNLIATIPGARKERIALAGHYDTKLFREFRFVGANDGGSSAAMLLELARVLKARRNEFTVEVLFLDGEEATLRDWGGTDHTYGSQYYVDNAKRTGALASLKAMVLVDMVGDRDLRIMRETASTKWLTDTIWATAKRLGYGSTFVDQSTRIEDDHIPFLEAGAQAVDIIDLEYPPWHTAGDTLDQTSARSLEIVGKTLEGAWGGIERGLNK